jgi:hypothetical protein
MLRSAGLLADFLADAVAQAVLELIKDGLGFPTDGQGGDAGTDITAACADQRLSPNVLDEFGPAGSRKPCRAPCAGANDFVSQVLHAQGLLGLENSSMQPAACHLFPLPSSSESSMPFDKLPRIFC